MIVQPTPVDEQTPRELSPRRLVVASFVAGTSLTICCIVGAGLASLVAYLTDPAYHWALHDLIGLSVIGLSVWAFGASIRLSWRNRIRWWTLLFLIYMGIYIPLTCNGGYYFSRSGKMRYAGIGLSVTDRALWQPWFARWEPFVDIEGKETSRGTLLGYFYSPLIRLDRGYWHQTEQLFSDIPK